MRFEKMEFASMLPIMGMVIVQAGYAGMAIISKMALNDGFNPIVLVTYRQLFSTMVTLPFALFLERKTRPKITGSILLHIFFCSLTGAFGNQVFYFIGLSNSPPMVASAMSNLLPGLTFVFAIIFRQETARIRTKSGQAKVLGTLACVGGAIMFSFCHGKVINLGNSLIQWGFADKSKPHAAASKTNSLLGPFVLFCGTSSWALWFIIQVKLSTKFSAPYTTTMLMSLMASVECAMVGVILERRPSAWSIRSPIRLLAALYSGILGSAVAFCIMSWCVEKRGPLFTSIFSPLLLILTTILSWAILHEKIYMGMVVGGVFIIGGLYSVIWGKDKETKEEEEMKSLEVNQVIVIIFDNNKSNFKEEDLQVQLHAPNKP